MSRSGLTIRRASPADWDRVMVVMVEWWGGRDLREMLPWVFFEHFRTTSLIVEHENELVGFLVGFLCPTHADEAYVHFVGVHPEWRRAGLASDLYRRFYAMAQDGGRSVVRAVTSPVNRDSIAFHQRLGFALMPGNGEADGLPVTLDRAGPAQHRVCLELRLDEGRRRRVNGAPESGARLTRLTDAEALDLLERGDLLELGFRADELRRRLHPAGEVTFIVDRNINYTDYCLSGCRFCAFYKKPGSGEGYLLTQDDIHRKIEETIALGGTAIMMQGGLSPDLDIRWFEEVFSGIKERYSRMHLHCLSPPEVVHIARQSGLTIEETLRRLRAAGLGSLPGGGAEVLVDRVRAEISPHKIPTDTWLEVMRVAHGLGMRTTATMMFGSLDAPAERVEHLRRIRDLQDETDGFTAFIPWTFQAGNTALEEGHVPATGIDYLRLLAVSRLYLDNVPNVQASWVTQGLRMGQVALAFGANDMGSTMIEENVVKAAGVSHTITVDEMVRLIRAAGFTPVQRDTMYGEVRRFD